MTKKILIVDDEPDLLKVTEFRLKSAGYDVLLAVDGEEAIDLAHKNPPDLILLDLRLPKMNGCDVCRHLKSDDRLKTVPVILFTASGIDRIEERVKEAAADDYLVKPFDGKELVEKIRKFIG